MRLGFYRAVVDLKQYSNVCLWEVYANTATSASGRNTPVPAAPRGPYWSAIGSGPEVITAVSANQIRTMRILLAMAYRPVAANLSVLLAPCSSTQVSHIRPQWWALAQASSQLSTAAYSKRIRLPVPAAAACAAQPCPAHRSRASVSTKQTLKRSLPRTRSRRNRSYH